MPKLTREVVAPVVAPLAPNGSMLARAIPVSQAVAEFIKITIYGVNRVGKSTLAADFPKPSIFISCEPSEAGGAESISLIEGIQLLKLGSKDELFKVCDELISDSYFQTVVLDTGTSLQDMILCELLGLDKLPEQLRFNGIKKEIYQRRSEMLKEALRPLLRLKKHVVILNQEKDHRPPDRGDDGKEIIDMTPLFARGVKPNSFFASDIGGGPVQWLHDACPWITRLYIAEEVIEGVVPGTNVTMYTKTGKKERRLLTTLQENFAAGGRSPNPSSIPEYIANPTFEKIRALAQGTLK